MEIDQIVDLLRRFEKFFTLIQKFFTPFMGVKTFEKLTIMKENISIRVMIKSHFGYVNVYSLILTFENMDFDGIERSLNVD